MIIEPNEFRNTPNPITSLQKNEVFVFGSNLAGKHGKGGALTALRWGARLGHAIGMQGRTYAIPTKDASIKTLPIEAIQPFVDEFIQFAKCNPEKMFLVTEIGCGLAGYAPKDMAPLFMEAIHVGNIKLPDRFWKELQSFY